MQIGTTPRCYALVPCAGVGERAGVGGPKQYHPVAGQAMVAHTLAALAAVPQLAATLVVLAPDDWVLVHDAARCLLRPAWVAKLIDACWDDEVGGLLALPVADTLKQAERGRAGPGAADAGADTRVAATVDRRGKWAAQTPQMFRLGLLRPALLHAGDSVTDESSAVELMGHAPRLVTGSIENFKVTWPEDFALAERLLRTTVESD